jgi:hypothetical protein
MMLAPRQQKILGALIDSLACRGDRQTTISSGSPKTHEAFERVTIERGARVNKKAYFIIKIKSNEKYGLKLAITTST